MALTRKLFSNKHFSEKGQSIALFAVTLPLVALFLVGVLDYMVSNARVMEAVAISDLSAHAGAQEILVLPGGHIKSSSTGVNVAASYFHRQSPSYISLGGVKCGTLQGRPACQVQARVRTAGFLFPARWITVNAVGYLAHGVTREDQ